MASCARDSSSSSFESKVIQARAVITQAFERYGTPPPLPFDFLFCAENAFLACAGDGVAFSFNGGKDCTVVLHLLLNVLQALGRRVPPVPTLYIAEDAPFSTLEQFVAECAATHAAHIRIDTYRGCSMKQALARFIAAHRVQAVVMGTRRTDPHSGKRLLPLCALIFCGNWQLI